MTKEIIVNMKWTDVQGTFPAKILIDHAVALAAYMGEGCVAVYSEGKASVYIPTGEFLEIEVHPQLGLRATSSSTRRLAEDEKERERLKALTFGIRYGEPLVATRLASMAQEHHKAAVLVSFAEDVPASARLRFLAHFGSLIQAQGGSLQVDLVVAEEQGKLSDEDEEMLRRFRAYVAAAGIC